MPVLIVALLLSGAAGLTYQVLWLRLLSLSFGVTTYAASAVLAGFMAGLALGSLLAGRVAGRSARPLRLLAFAEFTIALAGLLTIPAFGRLPALSVALQNLAGDNFAWLTFVRFAGAFLVLVVPTTFMGATLPLVAASRLVRENRPAARIGAAYAANTAGAIAGALVTGFFLIGSIGINASFLVAVACNLGAASLALWLSHRTESPERGIAANELPGAAAESVPVPASHAALHPVRRAVIIVLAVSGLASLALEIVWFRILVQFIAATTYAFTTMLAAVLCGIALGGWIAAWLLRRERNWLNVFLWLQALTAVAIVSSLTALGWTYEAGWRTNGLVEASILAILPATLLMGVSFPIGISLWSRAPESSAGAADMARDVGGVYAANVCGAIAGALLGGFLLLPLLGSRLSLVVCAGFYLACAALVAFVSPDRKRSGVTVAIVAAIFIPMAATVPDPFLVTLARRHGGNEKILWREEGVQTTVSVNRAENGDDVLYLDGLHQSNNSEDMVRLHRQIGHLPMALHKSPRRALVIGLGGGTTAGAVSRHPGVTIDIVELSDSVRKASEFFKTANQNVLAQPGVHLRVDDGRNYLLRTTETYDVITADIIQPIHAGAGLLYSVEYFTLARNALASDGLMLQWVGRRPETQYKLIVRSFQKVFPHTTAWLGGALLVGSKVPLSVSRTAFEAQRAHEATRQSLESVGLDSFEKLLAWFSAGARSLQAFIGEGPVLSDDRPQIEYHQSLPFERGNIDMSGLVRDLGEIRVFYD
jgi:spermidine synthase